MTPNACVAGPFYPIDNHGGNMSEDYYKGWKSEMIMTGCSSLKTQG